MRVTQAGRGDEQPQCRCPTQETVHSLAFTRRWSPTAVSALVDDLRPLLVNGQAAEAKAILGQVLGEVELKPARTKDGRPYLIARLKGSLKSIIPLLAKRDDANLVVAGACYVAIHNALAAWLVRRWALPRNGRRARSG